MKEKNKNRINTYSTERRLHELSVFIEEVMGIESLSRRF